MNKYLILTLIIISAGIFGGIVRFFNSSDLSKKINWKEFIKFILTGIGAAILIPLVLNMISSDLIKGNIIEYANYFIFAGFCFIGAYLSDRFLTTVGEKILNEVKKVQSKQESTNKVVNSLLENESEPIDSENKDKFDRVLQNINNKIEPKDKPLINRVLLTFGKEGKYSFRSIKGISNEIGTSVDTVTLIFDVLEDNDLIRKIRKRNDGEYLWGITSHGKSLKING
jgi:hypothetical protein